MWTSFRSSITRFSATRNSIWSRFNSTASKALKNDAIKFSEVRVIIKDAETNKNTWQILSRLDALNLARRQNLDLVLVSADSTPPVCKLENSGKVAQKEKEKEKKNRSSQKARATKEVLIKIGIDPHDLSIKMNRTRKFLLEGHPVKVVIFFHRKAMYKTKIHVARNSHLTNLPLMDINEISAHVFNSIMDIPTTIVKKDVTIDDTTSSPQAVVQKAPAPTAVVQRTRASKPVVRGGRDDDDDDDDDDESDDDSSDGDSSDDGWSDDDPDSETSSVASDISDVSSVAESVVSELPLQKSDMPILTKVHLRREVTFVPKLIAIEQLKKQGKLRAKL